MGAGFKRAAAASGREAGAGWGGRERGRRRRRRLGAQHVHRGHGGSRPQELCPSSLAHQAHYAYGPGRARGIAGCCASDFAGDGKAAAGMGGGVPLVSRRLTGLLHDPRSSSFGTVHARPTASWTWRAQNGKQSRPATLVSLGDAIEWPCRVSLCCCSAHPCFFFFFSPTSSQSRHLRLATSLSFLTVRALKMKLAKHGAVPRPAHVVS